MPPKKSKKPDQDGKAPSKRATRGASAKADNEKVDVAEGSPVNDGSKKTAKKPASSPSPAKPSTPSTGDKRKRADEEDENQDEEDSRSPPRSRRPKKPKLSPKTGRRVKFEVYLRDRVKDLGFNVEPVKGHEPDDEDKDKPDEDWASMQHLRQRCDDRLDEIEEAIRTLGRDKLKKYTNLPELDIPEHKSDETRHEKRQKDESIKVNEEIDPIAEKKRVKKSKNFPDGKKYRSAKQLGDLVKILEKEFGDELARRRVKHPSDVSLAKYPSKRVNKAKAAAEARGESPKLTMNLQKQWTKHGLSLRELVDLYNRHGSEVPAPARDELVKKCQRYNLSTAGNLWSLEKAILMYELSSKQRMYGLSQEAINQVISALGDIEAPVDTEEDDNGGDSSDDATGPYDDLKTDGKGKDSSKIGKSSSKDSTAARKDGKKSSQEAGSSSPKDGSKGDKKDGKKDGKKTGKKDDKKDGKKDNKSTGANTNFTKRNTRSSKKIDLRVEDNRFIALDEITVTDGGQTQRFTQVDVSGTAERCMWNAVQLHWIGTERAPARRVAEQYPVNDRVRDLWNAVMHPAEGTTNPARQSRRRLYMALQQASLSSAHSNLEARLTNRRMGDTDMLQVVADALDIEIFIYSPQHCPDGAITWHRYVRGQPQNDSARQMHLMNYMHAEHWTALTPLGAGPITLPALGEMHRHPITGGGIPIPALTRLQPGDAHNTDLRDEDLHDDPEDGHVADRTEVEEEEEESDDAEDDEDEEMDEQEDADGDDGPAPPPAAGAPSTATTSAAARRTSPSASHPPRSSSAPASTRRNSHSPSSASQKRARRRTRSRSKSKSRSASQPNGGVQKNIQTNQSLSKNARKKKAKQLRKIFQNFYVGVPSPQNVAGALRSPFPRAVVSAP
ncbi:hypothetical protein QM012_006167 [Aureobasidium pullulans]|uniref:Uncharacterized protein n=1 Tax=Aureobasidium pullulans TaxID=5580 RepID=A0ABR0TRU5_AURPU